MSHHAPRPEDLFLTRRDFLERCGMGLGGLAFATLAGRSEAAEQLNPLAPRAAQFPGRAKRVVHFFLNGGPSAVDTFDPKPALTKYDGKALPSPNLQTERKTGAAFGSPFTFQSYGRSGLEISELFPNVARSADDLCVIRSMQADLPNHEPSLMLMNCGHAQMTRPSLGSWVTYGLGTENQNLPGFVAMCPGGYPIKDAENWQSGFLPGAYQGTFIDTQHTAIEKLIENIQSRHASLADQRRQLDLLRRLNAEHLQRRANESRLEARIQSFELAYRMQMEAADAFDISREPAHIRELYGAGVHARQTLIARRLLERGVRFVQLWHGALLDDLRQRGMLEDTLVIWGGEFGRTPTVELGDSGKSKLGRDHNPYGFSMWLAGGGVRGGIAHGATDEFGFRAAEKKVHVHDLHATILHLLGFDHERFTYRYAGRDFRLTDVEGEVVKEILA